MCYIGNILQALLTPQTYPMKRISFTIALLFVTVLQISAQESCIIQENLKALDALWEKSLMETNLDYFKSNVSEDFVWIHNHAGRTDSKETLLEFVSKIRQEKPDHWKSRIQKDTRVISFGTTGVVYGYTAVELYDGRISNYNYMRTYAEKDGKCYLIANHTMVVPDSED